MKQSSNKVELFLDSVKSEETRVNYASYLKKHMEIMALDDLLHENDPRLIEREVIEFIIEMKN